VPLPVRGASGSAPPALRLALKRLQLPRGFTTRVEIGLGQVERFADVLTSTSYGVGPSSGCCCALAALQRPAHPHRRHLVEPPRDLGSPGDRAHRYMIIRLPLRALSWSRTQVAGPRHVLFPAAGRRTQRPAAVPDTDDRSFGSSRASGAGPRVWDISVLRSAAGEAGEHGSKEPSRRPRILRCPAERAPGRSGAEAPRSPHR